MRIKSNIRKVSESLQSSKTNFYATFVFFGIFGIFHFLGELSLCLCCMQFLTFSPSCSFAQLRAGPVFTLILPFLHCFTCVVHFCQFHFFTFVFTVGRCFPFFPKKQTNKKGKNTQRAQATGQLLLCTQANLAAK